MRPAVRKSSSNLSSHRPERPDLPRTAYVTTSSQVRRTGISSDGPKGGQTPDGRSLGGSRRASRKHPGRRFVWVSPVCAPEGRIDGTGGRYLRSGSFSRRDSCSMRRNEAPTAAELQGRLWGVSGKGAGTRPRGLAPLLNRTRTCHSWPIGKFND